MPRIPQNLLNNHLPIQEGNQTRQPWSNHLAVEWSNWEDSRQQPVGHPTLPDRIPSTTPGAEPPRDAKDSGSARSHSTHLETSSSDRP